MSQEEMRGTISYKFVGFDERAEVDFVHNENKNKSTEFQFLGN